MAETVHLYLKANGSEIQGESRQTKLGRENSIECLAFSDSIRSLRMPGTGLARGRRQYEPLMIRKRIDKSSPLLSKALVRNEVIEGVFKFFRPSPTGDGTTEHFFTVEIKGGRLIEQQQFVPDLFDKTQIDDDPLEEVAFTFRSIKIRYENGGIEAEDTWNPPAGVFS